MAKITKVYAYPKNGVHAEKELQINWAKENEMTWTIEEFIPELLRSSFMLTVFKFGSYTEQTNEHDVTINAVELASIIAHDMVAIFFINNPDDIYRSQDEETTEYTSVAQEVFDEYYDEVYETIIKSKID